MKEEIRNYKKIQKQKLFASAVAGVCITAIMLPEITLAVSKFDINAGVNAATRPLVEGVTTHWGKGVMLSGIVSSLVGEGDARQRAIRALIGSGVAGAVVLGLIALLS